MPSYRIETDSMGQMKVPASAYYGPQTARALENFPISHSRFPRSFIRALALVKKHAALSNADLKLIPTDIATAIVQAADEVRDGKFDSEFLVDIFQTGSGTSTNMNANEVIANRAAELMGRPRGDKSVHPNDHVNCGQSSNDVIPSVIHIAACDQIHRGLLPSLSELRDALTRKAEQFNEVLKIGRTHLQDAVPMRLGQEFGGYSSQIEYGIKRLRNTLEDLSELALGGTAIGTGLNTHPDSARKTIAGISAETGLKFREAKNHFAAQGAQDACVGASGALRAIAISLIKIANDIRFLGSGPRLGYGELKLPATQPGSSIMPGKVNPVMCEMMIQVGGQVIGNDGAISFGGVFGNFELNTMLPLLAHNLLQSIELLTTSGRTFSQRCVEGLEPNIEKCQNNIEQSLAMSTALAPVLGYDKAAAIAKAAHESNRTVREVAKEMSGLNEQELDRLLDPRAQAGGSG